MLVMVVLRILDGSHLLLAKQTRKAHSRCEFGIFNEELVCLWFELDHDELADGNVILPG